VGSGWRGFARVGNDHDDNGGENEAADAGAACCEWQETAARLSTAAALFVNNGFAVHERGQKQAVRGLFDRVLWKTDCLELAFVKDLSTI
jgi:hypothetical protein